MPSVNEQILHVWKLVDGGGGAITGLAGSMTKTLEFFASSSSLAAGSELVTVAEIGSSGNYAITYTPGDAGLYRLTINETTQGWLIVYEDVVAATPSEFADTYAYCSEADVCAWAGVADYHTTSVPTEVQVLGFMRMRAAELYGLMVTGTKEFGGLGDKAPGPTGSALALDTTTDAGRSLDFVLRMANAVGAAVDALLASTIGEQPRRSERAAELATLYDSMAKSVLRCARIYGSAVGKTFRAATHISHGGVSPFRPESGLAESFGFEPGKRW